MAGRGPSRQELIRRWRQAGFIGRQGELALFKDTLRRSAEESPQFLFHIRGPAGVGKSTLVRQLESAAREAEACTAYVDESVGDVVEAMETISLQLAQQGSALKDFDKLLATYRQRRYEVNAEPAAGETSGSGGGQSGTPSPGSLIASKLGLVGLGMIPGVGAFTGAVDAKEIAAGADRVKAVLSARLRSHEDVQLVMSPLQVLTPVFLRDLAEAARRRPWLVLFFDTYERIGPLLDEWLRNTLVSDRYGDMPANVLVVLAGQGQLNRQCWEDWLDLVTDLPLDVFTDTEARQLLAAKGINDERVIGVILQLSGRLPVLVSTLAEARPTNPADVGDPSGTAVERFLRWEADPARRAAALACAFPRELDEDVYRAAAATEEANELFGWLRSMPFVTDRAGKCHYHDVVRTAMLRLQRQQSPQRWQEQHIRLADAFARQRAALEPATGPADSCWTDERWRGHRLQETYHRLCAGPHTALADALREALDAYDHDTTTLRRWAQTLAQAGSDSDVPTLRDWSRRLLDAMETPTPGISALTLILSCSALDTDGRVHALILRGDSHQMAEEYGQALSDYAAALALQEEAVRAVRGRGETYRLLGRNEEALAEFTRALERDPDHVWTIGSRGQTYGAMGRYEEALADFARAIELDEKAWTIACRGQTYHVMGRYEEALADYSRATELDPESAWITASRGETHRLLGQYEEALADFARAIERDPDDAWTIGSRGQTYGAMGRYEEALADFARAIELAPEKAWVYGNRGQTYDLMGRYEEALADFARALELEPDYTWVYIRRGQTYRVLGRYEEALADFARAVELQPENVWAFAGRGVTLRYLGRYEEALTDLTRALELDPDNSWFRYEKAVVLHALGHPDRDAQLARALDLLAPGSAAAGEDEIPDKGNLFLVSCLLPGRGEAERRLADFLDSGPSRGQVGELIAAVTSLVDVIPSEAAQLTSFVRRLELLW
ncbi:tetratricopeptide repeat protein [Kitasatospora sp. NPDC017646]|uniref:tetratricopeptide repeat protein n=1 Tax=Kitasatospora sp. NPDC017646 TaxID=3364024 RepID=UPI0037B0EA01